jgi:hypothetical protein
MDKTHNQKPIIHFFSEHLLFFQMMPNNHLVIEVFLIKTSTGFKFLNVSFKTCL